jgi:hypothetical protein
MNTQCTSQKSQCIDRQTQFNFNAQKLLQNPDFSFLFFSLNFNAGPIELVPSVSVEDIRNTLEKERINCPQAFRCKVGRELAFQCRNVNYN